MREIGAALTLASLLLFQPTLAQRGAEPVRIAHAQDFPPLAEVRDGKSEGLAVDILRAAAMRAGVEVQFVAVPFEQVHLTLADGRAEGVFPPSRSLPNVANCSTSRKGCLSLGALCTCVLAMCLPRTWRPCPAKSW